MLPGPNDTLSFAPRRRSGSNVMVANQSAMRLGMVIAAHSFSIGCLKRRSKTMS